MIDSAVLPGFLVAIVVVTVAPGPDNAYIAAVAVARGPRAGVLSAVGMALGMTVHVTAAALGIAVVLRSTPWALNGVRIVGAVYLGWLAFGTLRTARHAGFAGRAPLPDRQVLRRAALTNLTNPKVILFFAAFLPQFERGGRGPSAPQMLVLGMMFLLVGLLVDSAVGLTVGRIGDAGAPGGRAATALGVAAGFTLGGLSVLLLAEALYDLVFG